MFQAPRRTPSPPPQRSLSRHGSSNGSFVCNVSDDEVIERDVDLEIEARIRNNTLPGSDSESELPAPTRAHRTASTRSMPRRASGSPAPAVKSTLSQRMLSALQRKKAQTAGRTKRSGSILLEVVQAENGTIPEMPRAGSNHSMGTDIDGLVVPDPFYDPSLDPVYMSDDESQPPVSHSISTSCKDRLEARISDRLLQNKSSLSAHPDGNAALVETANNDLSVVYTNRRTYPAESTKKADPRYSDNHLDTRYERAGVTPEQRVNRAAGNYYQQQYGSQQYSNQHAHHHHQAPPREQPQAPSYHHNLQPQQNPYVNIRGPIEPTMEVLDANKSLPVAFHFQGQNGRAQANQQGPRDHHQARRQQATEPPRRDERDHYVALSQSVDQIEQVVDGLENLMASSSFWSLAMVALRELELLRESIKQVRTNGTTMILAEVGRAQSQMPFRHLVARAAALQNRIEVLIHRIRTMS